MKYNIKLNDIDWDKIGKNAATVGHCADDYIMEVIDIIEQKCGYSPNVIKKIGNQLIIGYVDQEDFTIDNMAFAKINYITK